MILFQSVSLWEEWSALTTGDDTVTMVTSPTVIVPDRVTKLSDKQLRIELVSKGALVGPITPSTSMRSIIYVSPDFESDIADARI